MELPKPRACLLSLLSPVDGLQHYSTKIEAELKLLKYVKPHDQAQLQYDYKKSIQQKSDSIAQKLTIQGPSFEIQFEN